MEVADWIILNKVDLKELTIMMSYNENPVWKGNKDLRSCFTHLAYFIKTDVEGSNESKIKISINQIQLTLLDYFRNGDIYLNKSLTDSYRSVDLFIKQLDVRYDWTLKKMAGHCGLGVTNLVSIFKQIGNITPMQYLTQKRLEAAAALLMGDKKLSIKEIAYGLGFGSNQYFSNLFLKKYKCTPQNYKLLLSGKKTIK